MPPTIPGKFSNLYASTRSTPSGCKVGYHVYFIGNPL